MLARDLTLVLLDVRLPDMNGFEVASLIRERPSTRHLPIIFLTAYDAADSETSAGVYFVRATLAERGAASPPAAASLRIVILR